MIWKNWGSKRSLQIFFMDQTFFLNVMIVIELLSVISQPFPLYTWQVWNTMTALCTLFDSLGKLTLFLLTYAHPGAARGFSIDSCKISWTLNYFKTVERCNCIYCLLLILQVFQKRSQKQQNYFRLQFPTFKLYL